MSDKGELLTALGEVLVGPRPEPRPPREPVTLAAPGLYSDVPFADYLADPCERPSLSSSAAKTLLQRSPMHARYEHPRLGVGRIGERGSKAMDAGTVIHALALGCGQEYIAVPFGDWRTNEAKKQRDAARAAGLIPILAYQLDNCAEVAEIIKPLLPVGGEHEVTAVWESTVAYSGAPVLCRGRIDSLIAPCAEVWDVKTTADAARAADPCSLVSDCRDVEAACRLDSVETLRPELAGRWAFRYLFVEVEPPYAVVVAEIAGAMLELGRRRWRRAVETWGRCLAANDWPGPHGGRVRPEPPPWAIEQDLDQQLAGVPANSGGESLGL